MKNNTTNDALAWHLVKLLCEVSHKKDLACVCMGITLTLKTLLLREDPLFLAKHSVTKWVVWVFAIL